MIVLKLFGKQLATNWRAWRPIGVLPRNCLVKNSEVIVKAYFSNINAIKKDLEKRVGVKMSRSQNSRGILEHFQDIRGTLGEHGGCLYEKKTNVCRILGNVLRILGELQARVCYYLPQRGLYT